MPVRNTQAELREAVRDARDWTPGYAERAAFTAWVTDGSHALNPRDAAPRAAVWVKAYTRNGHTVAAHWRAAPPAEGATGTATHQASGPRPSTDIPDVVQVGLLDRMLRPLGARLPMGAGRVDQRVAKILANGPRLSVGGDRTPTGATALTSSETTETRCPCGCPQRGCLAV